MSSELTVILFSLVAPIIIIGFFTAETIKLSNIIYDLKIRLKKELIKNTYNMNKLIILKHSSSAIQFNPETLEAKEVSYFDTNIDYSYLADSDCIVNFEGKDYEAKEGDLIVKAYGFDGDRKIIIFRADALVEYSKEYAAKREASRNSQCKECVPVSDRALGEDPAINAVV